LIIVVSYTTTKKIILTENKPCTSIQHDLQTYSKLNAVVRNHNRFALNEAHVT